MARLLRTIRKVRLTAMLMVAGGAMISTPSDAQIGQLLGSATGSYCIFKKKNKIRVNTSLPLTFTQKFSRNMTMRRLAEMTKSKGFSTFVIEKDKCGTLLINNIPSSLSCELRARMEDPDESAGELKDGEARFSADEILALTESEAPRYPRMTGLLNKKNQCVIQ